MATLLARVWHALKHEIGIAPLVPITHVPFIHLFLISKNTNLHQEAAHSRLRNSIWLTVCKAYYWDIHLLLSGHCQWVSFTYCNVIVHDMHGNLFTLLRVRHKAEFPSFS